MSVSFLFANHFLFGLVEKMSCETVLGVSLSRLLDHMYDVVGRIYSYMLWERRFINRSLFFYLIFSQNLKFELSHSFFDCWVSLLVPTFSKRIYFWRNKNPSHILRVSIKRKANRASSLPPLMLLSFPTDHLYYIYIRYTPKWVCNTTDILLAYHHVCPAWYFIYIITSYCILIFLRYGHFSEL